MPVDFLFRDSNRPLVDIGVAAIAQRPLPLVHDRWFGWLDVGFDRASSGELLRKSDRQDFFVMRREIVRQALKIEMFKQQALGQSSKLAFQPPDDLEHMEGIERIEI